jgi:hypothetical protein
MKTILSGIILLFSLFLVNVAVPAQTRLNDYSIEIDGLTFKLTSQSCQLPTLKMMVDPKEQPSYKAGTVSVGKDSMKVCYSLTQDPKIVCFIDEVGGHIDLPKEFFPKLGEIKKF